MDRLFELAPLQGSTSDLENRVRRTLQLAHRWGYAPTIEALGENLLGGLESQEKLLAAARTAGDVVVQDGFAHIAGYAHLLEKSKRRVGAHARHNGWATAIARDYARTLVRSCPLVECICLSGSTASGGYDATDDIDFDLFVMNDAKYLVYLVALVLGLNVSLRNRGHARLRKITCVNVLWTESEWRPFARQDEDLAYELLRCRPLVGARKFAEVIAANDWARTYFPQLGDNPVSSEAFSRPNVFGRFLRSIARRPRLLRAFNELSRVATHAIYSFAHWLDRKDSDKVNRLRFLQRAKFPYEVFQD